MKLFTVGKVGLFLDSWDHATEKRRNEDVKIVILTLRLEPFDAKRAASMGHEDVRPSLFNLNDTERKRLFAGASLVLDTPRQILKVYLFPEHKQASAAFDQVRIYGARVRVDKDADVYTLVFKASCGPLDETALAFIQDWHLSQRFVSFDEAEPGVFDEPTPEKAEDDAEPDQPLFDVEKVGRGAAGTCIHGTPILEPCEQCDAEQGSAPEPARKPARRHQDPKAAAKAKQKKGRGVH